MPVAFSYLRPDLVIYDCSMELMGNTTVRTLKVRPIRVLNVDATTQKAQISWNGNPPTWKYAGYFKGNNIRKAPPEWLNRFGKDPACYFCGQTQAEGHAACCKHPKVQHADPPNL